MTEPLGVAVIGLGIGQQHARAFAADPRSRLRWVLDLQPARMREVAEALGQGRPAESFEQVLADASVQVVSIASPDDCHAAQVIAALDAGKHVFCEKPLCRSLDELRAIHRALARTPGLHLACNLVLRAAPLYRWLRTAMRGGELGTVYAIDGDYLYGRLEKITDGWRQRVEDYSVFQGGGVHMLDLLLWLQDERPTHVSAVSSQRATRGTAFRYPDYVAATYSFPSGLLGRVTANFACVHRHQHVVRIFGTQGTFLHDDAGPRLHVSRDPHGVPRSIGQAPVPASKGDLIPQFLDGIARGIDPTDAARTELDLMAACIAADRAAATAQTQQIEYFT